MKEHISELTPEEFQKTFPITLTESDPEFAAWYEEEKTNILRATGGKGIVRISHIGSTAIPGIRTKPIVDILLELDGTCHMDQTAEALKGIGFGTEILQKKDNPFELLMAKGMTVRGFEQKAFLLHVRYAGDWNELYFRDYLLDHPDTAEEYSRLKERILQDIRDGKTERMPNGRPNGYFMAKLSFVNDVSEKARQEYGGRYSIARAADLSGSRRTAE